MKTSAKAPALRELIRKMERTLGVLGKSELSCCGVTLAQCHALVEIGRAQTIALNELAELLRLDISTMSRTVDNLVDRKLAKRQPDPNDRRCVVIRLTEKGNDKFKCIEAGMEEYYRKVYEKIPENKREPMLESLTLLLDALNQTGCC